MTGKFQVVDFLAKCLADIFRRFTEDAESVIARLEDEKMPPEEEHGKQVKHDKL